MAIQMRKGSPEDFDPSKMLPGEFAVTIGNNRQSRRLYICFAPGVVKQLGTYEDFADQIEDATDEIKQQYITAFNEILEQIEDDKETAVEDYNYVVEFRNLLDTTYKTDIEKSVNDAATSAAEAKAADASAEVYKENAKTYMDTANEYAKEAKAAAASITGALKPQGTIAFADLPALSSTDEGAMYNISDEFISTSNFKDGGNITYPAGTNVYKTADNMWDCLAGQLSNYLMLDDVDVAVENSMPDYEESSTLQELVAGEKLSTAFGKIKTAIKNLVSIIKLLGTADISKISDGTVTGILNSHNESISKLNSNIKNNITVRAYSLGTISFTSANQIKDIEFDISTAENPITVLDIRFTSPTVGVQYINWYKYGSQNNFRLFSSVAQNVQVAVGVLCFK